MSDTGTTRRKITPEEVAIVIPARMESTRLPGKPLRMVRGKSMVLWAWEAAKASKRAGFAAIVTDSLEIADWCSGDIPMMADYRGSHPTGSDRIAAAMGFRDGDDDTYVAFSGVWPGFVDHAKIIVNLQCDEPDITGADLDRLIEELIDHSLVQVATYRCRRDADMHGTEGWDQPIAETHVVKVVCDHNDNALYFSRAGIPGDIHVGVYAFRRKILESFARYPQGDLEKAEDLEQLRLLENGIPIRVLDLGRSVRSVNTEADLKAVNDG